MGVLCLDALAFFEEQRLLLESLLIFLKSMLQGLNFLVLLKNEILVLVLDLVYLLLIIILDFLRIILVVDILLV